MSQNNERQRALSERTRAMRPWGDIRERVRMMQAAFEDTEVVIWAEPIEWTGDRVKNYEVRTVPVSEFKGAHPDAIWG